MRLIDADALVVKIKDWQGDKEDVDMSDPHDVGYYSAMGRAIRLTALASTIDAVPVVRCKNCKHYDAGCWCAELERGTAEDFFCTYGERKER